MNWSISPSQLKTAECPYRFYLSYILKKKGEYPSSVQLGTDIHDIIFDRLQKKPSADDPPIVKRLRDLVGDEEVTVEPKVTWIHTTPQGEKFTFKGYPDLETPTRILDLKTTRADMLHRVFEGDKIQMAIYEYATSKPTFIVKIPREGIPMIKVHRIDPTPERIREIIDRARIIHEIIRTRKPPPPNPGKICKFCAFKSYCEFVPQEYKNNNVRELEANRTKDD